MAYKISGNLGDDAKITIIDETTDLIDTISEEVAGSYEVDYLSPGNKTVIARRSDGRVMGFGNLETTSYVGNRGMWCCGNNSTGDLYTNDIDYITITSLGNASNFGDMSMEVSNPAGCSNGLNERGVQMGGMNASATYQDTIQYINIMVENDSEDFGNLSFRRASAEGASNGINNRGIVGGGYYTIVRDDIDYFTINSLGNSAAFGDLTTARNALSACDNGTNDRAIFGGGSEKNIIDYITMSSLSNAYDFGDLLINTYNTAACSNKTLNRGIFAGTYNATETLNITYVAINSLADAVTFGNLGPSAYRYGQRGLSNGVGNRGVFAGGHGGGYRNNIEYINISSLGDSEDFGDLTLYKYNTAPIADA